MGMKLTVPPQYRDQFEFIFHIDQSADGKTVVCRAEIFERSILKATLQIATKNQTRLEVTDAVLERCIRWADLRLKDNAFPTCSHGTAEQRQPSLAPISDFL
jgi:hypothetical protein